MRKPLLALFVLVAVVVGLLALLLIGVFRVDDDGWSRDDADAHSSVVTLAV